MSFFKCCSYVDGSNCKKISSHAHDQLGGAFPPEVYHYESNTMIQVNVYNVSESVQPKPEKLSLDATSKLFTIYSLFG